MSRIYLLAFFIVLILFISLSQAKETFALEESTGPTECVITPTTDSAPDITGYLFVDTISNTPEQFKLAAQLTDQSFDHKFTSDFVPYRARIAYGVPAREDYLGEMRLFQVDPMPTSKKYDDQCEFRCHKKEDYYCSNTDDGNSCVDQDPLDQKDSWVISSRDQNLNDTKFKFGIIGPASIRIYQNSTSNPDNKGSLVCLKDVNVVASKGVTVTVYQPLHAGDKVEISGFVQDHTKGVANAAVNITIGPRTIITTTDSSGNYSYNSDTTSVWGLQSGQTYFVKATAQIGGTTYSSESNFGVDLPGPTTSGTKNPGVNSLLALNRYRYYDIKTDGHWTTTTNQISAPNPDLWLPDGFQGYLFKDDDGSGPLTSLFDCPSGNAHFNSLLVSSCPNKDAATIVGYIYDPATPQPSGTHPLYLCKRDDTGEQKTTLSKDCRDDPTLSTPYQYKTTLGFVSDTATCDIKQPGVPVSANTPYDLDQKYLDKVNKPVLYQGLNDADENNPKNAEQVFTGINYSACGLGFYCMRVYLSTIISSISCTLSSVTKILGLNINYCQNTANFGRGTNLIDNKSKSLHGSYVYQFQRPDPPSDPRVINDKFEGANPKCDNGNTITNNLTNRLGNDASIYTADFPKTIINSASGNPQSLIKDLNEEAKLNQSGVEIEHGRTGQDDPNRCLYFQGTFYKGLTPQGFEGVDCSKLLNP